MHCGRHVVGIGFILISSLLYLADYAVVAAYGFTVTSWGNPPGRLGTSAETYSNPLLVTLSVAALVIGVVYLVAAEAIAFRQLGSLRSNGDSPTGTAASEDAERRQE